MGGVWQAAKDRMVVAITVVAMAELLLQAFSIQKLLSLQDRARSYFLNPPDLMFCGFPA